MVRVSRYKTPRTSPRFRAFRRLLLLRLDSRVDIASSEPV